MGEKTTWILQIGVTLVGEHPKSWLMLAVHRIYLSSPCFPINVHVYPIGESEMGFYQTCLSAAYLLAEPGIRHVANRVQSSFHLTDSQIQCVWKQLCKDN